MADVRLRYQPQGGTLRKFHDDDSFVRVVIGPLGSGKTFAAIFELLRRADNQKPVEINGVMVRRSRAAVVRNTYSELLASTIKDYKEVAPMHLGDWKENPFPQHTIRYKRSDGSVVECEVMFLAFDREDHVRKIRGLQLTFAWVDEAREMAKPVIDMLLGRLGRYPQRAVYGDYWFGAWMTSNAPPADDWLGVIAMKAQEPGWAVFIQPGAVTKEHGKWVVNPRAENLRNHQPGYYENQLANKKDDWIRSNLANEFVYVTDGRPVHPDFSQRLHVVDFGEVYEPVPGRPCVIGIDFGRTPAAAFLQQQITGQWHVFDELCTENMGAKRFGEVLLRYINQRYSNHRFEFYGDPAGDDMAQTDDETPFTMLAASGIQAFPAAASNDFLVRTEALDTLLRLIVDGEPAIVVSSRCTTLVRGLSGRYRLRRVQVSGTERYHDKPEKDPTSHVCEALHYGLLGAGEGDRAMFDHAFDSDLEQLKEWEVPAEAYE